MALKTKKGCAAILNKTVIKKCFPKEAFIFIAEAWRSFITGIKSHKKFIIFSDSLFILISQGEKKKRTH